MPLLWKTVGLAGDAGLVAAPVPAVWKESLAAVGALPWWAVLLLAIMPKPTDATQLRHCAVR
ncbi:MAG: hypothetical protein ABS81_22025 [Pseudonocardia sp. SCN 72-86]|nr:MAG: hypothetical protein ABS81_22025 [Pseudonocardia sp. SCN 72-86]